MKKTQSMINVINENSFKGINNDNNDSMNSYESILKHKVARVDKIAKNVCDFLGGDWKKSKAFYCKVAWSMTERDIYYNAEIAVKKGKNPPALFNYLCKKMMNN